MLVPCCVGWLPVEKVIDGDTLVVQVGHGSAESVRLIGVDAPEVESRFRKGEPLGDEARAWLVSQIGDGNVRLVAEAGREDRDRYDRLLRYVYTEDGKHLNAEIVRAGFARAYTRFPFAKQDRFVELELEARRNRRGLWRGQKRRSTPVP